MSINKDISKYLEFIQECRDKDYTGMITHKHHIIPITMTEYYNGENINDANNILKISCEDHFLAHWILANCFEETHHYFESNLRACGLLFKWAKNPESVREAISISRKGKCFKTPQQLIEQSIRMKGNKNALGLKHSYETKKLIAHESRLSFRKRYILPEGVYYFDDISPKCYRSCTECDNTIIYVSAESAKNSEIRKSKCPSCAAKGVRRISNKPRKKILDTSKIGKYNKSGSNNPRSMRLYHVFSGLEFGCMVEAIKWSGIPYGRFKKLIGIEYIKVDKNNE